MNIFPKFEDLKNIKNISHTAIIYQFVADTLTPISIYQKITKEKPYSFLLESAENNTKLSRYSFIGLNPKKIFEFKNGVCVITEKDKLKFEDFDDPLKILKKEILGTPDGIFALYETIIVFDHFTQKVSFIKYLNLKSKNLKKEYEEIKNTFDVLKEAILQNDSNLKELEFTKEILSEKKFESNFTKTEFCKKVEKILEKIKNGETYQLQFSQRLKLILKDKDNSFDCYRRLRLLNPSPYMYFLKYPEFDIVGASPETLVRVENKDILVRPIAGKRKKTEDELINSEKEQAEHLMLVDLARNDTGKIADISSVETQHLMHIERFSHVVHLVTDIRGIYSGAVGYFDFHGNMDMAIAIRTMLIKNNYAYIQAAGGIVYDSIPDQEYKESMNKMNGCLAAIL